MFTIDPLKINQYIQGFFTCDKRKIKLKTEKIERECEMFSLQTSKKHKIQYRFTVTAIVAEDGTLQFGTHGEPGVSYDLDISKYGNEPVLQAINNVCEEIRKNLKIPDHKKQ